MRKRIAAMVTAAAMVLTMAGCGTNGAENNSAPESSSAAGTSAETAGTTGADETASDPVKLIIWGGVPAENGPQAVCDLYNSTNTDNVTVEYYRYVNDDEGNTKLDMALAGGEQIDLFISYTPTRRDQRIESGNTMDITELCQKHDIDLVRDFGPIAETSLVDGRVYSIPTAKFVDLILYNKNMLDEAGLAVPTADTTWEEFAQLAKALTKGEGAEKVYGTNVHNGAEFFIAPFITTKYKNTVPYLNSDKTAVEWVSNPDFKTAYELAERMMYEDKSTPDWETFLSEKLSVGGETKFFNNQWASWIIGSHAIRYVKDTENLPHDFVTAFSPLPRFDENQDTYYAGIQSNDHFAVNSKCKNPEAAVKFLKWYYTEGFEPMIYGGRLPLYQEYDVDKAYEIISQGAEGLIDEESFKNTVFANYENTNIVEADPNKTTVTKIAQEETESFFLKLTDLETMLKNLESRCNEVIQ